MTKLHPSFRANKVNKCHRTTDVMVEVCLRCRGQLHTVSLMWEQDSPQLVPVLHTQNTEYKSHIWVRFLVKILLTSSAGCEHLRACSPLLHRSDLFIPHGCPGVSFSLTMVLTNQVSWTARKISISGHSD